MDGKKRDRDTLTIKMSNEQTSDQVKSKKRVADHGEVFTSKREVNAMLDLVKQETERIDSRFLEPACGNGNFLVEILRRKLAVVKKQYGKSPADWEKYAILALTSLYGVELLQDNVDECQERLFTIFEADYKAHCKNETHEGCIEAAKYILRRNILCGDALTLKASSGEPIIFSEWAMVTGNQIKRRDFRLDEMLEGNTDQLSLFNADWEYDEEVKAFIPKPIREYELCDYRRVQDVK